MEARGGAGTDDAPLLLWWPKYDIYGAGVYICTKFKLRVRTVVRTYFWEKMVMMMGEMMMKE
jgi:hypothetical protein